MSLPFLSEPGFLEEEHGSAILTCINHGRWLEDNLEEALERGDIWLTFFGITRARDLEYDLTVPVLEAEDEILQRDVNRTFATSRYRNTLLVLLYKCKKKFGDYQQNLSYMSGFLLLFFDMGTTYKILTILNSNPRYLMNYWRSENVTPVIDGWILFDILPDYLPELSEFFVEANIAPDIAAISQKWFGGCFIQNLPCPYLLKFMDGLFEHGIYFSFRFSLSLLLVLQDFLQGHAIYEIQRVIRLLSKDRSPNVTPAVIQSAIDSCEENEDQLAELCSFDLTEARHKAFSNHLKMTLTQANYTECLMPVELEEFSDDEEGLVEEGVIALKKCIQEKRINPERLIAIFEQLKVDLNIA